MTTFTFMPEPLMLKPSTLLYMLTLPESMKMRLFLLEVSELCSIVSNRDNLNAQRESLPEASDHPYRVQRHLIVKMMAVRVGRRVPYLEATRDEQP
jgi:hypothetical protein